MDSKKIHSQHNTDSKQTVQIIDLPGKITSMSSITAITFKNAGNAVKHYNFIQNKNIFFERFTGLINGIHNINIIFGMWLV